MKQRRVRKNIQAAMRRLICKPWSSSRVALLQWRKEVESTQARLRNEFFDPMVEEFLKLLVCPYQLCDKTEPRPVFNGPFYKTSEELLKALKQ